MSEMSREMIESRRATIRAYVEQMIQAGVHSKKELFSKLNLGLYDTSFSQLCADVLNEGIDPESALEGLAKQLGEVIPASEKRKVKAPDRRLTGITESPQSKPKLERSGRCGVCFQTDRPPDDWCEICGVAVHTECGQYEGDEAPPGSVVPFRVDQDKGLNVKACGYCRASRKMTAKGVKDVQPAGNVICEICGQAAKHSFLIQITGAATKWAHVACARFQPGSSLGVTGAKRYVGQFKDAVPCSICQDSSGAVTHCGMCNEDTAQNVHVICALMSGGFGIRPRSLVPSFERLICNSHKIELFGLNSDVANDNGLAKYLTSPLGIALQRYYIPPGEPAPCGVCLSMEIRPNDMIVVCDGCGVRCHVSCFAASVKGLDPEKIKESVTQQDFFCFRCLMLPLRGSVGQCAMCPHESPLLAMQHAEVCDEFVHSYCLMRSSADALMRLKTNTVETRKCYVCDTTRGSLATCVSCSETYHPLCVSLVCDDFSKLEFGQKITKCLAHCDHTHGARRISPLKMTAAIGTGFLPHRRWLSAVCNMALERTLSDEAMRDNVSILPDWVRYPEETQVQILAAPYVPPTASEDVPGEIAEKVLCAVTRAWEQTRMEMSKKRSRNGASAMGDRNGGLRDRSSHPVSERNGTGVGETRTSTRVHRRIAYDEDGDNTIKRDDEPLEISEVWPLLEPVLKRPCTTDRLLKMLHRERAVDDMLLLPSCNCPLPPVKLFPEQHVSVNPFVPPRFETFTPLERSKAFATLEQRPGVPLLRSGSFRDIAEFAERRCCLGRRRNDLDIASLNLLTVRGMGLPSHLFLMHHAPETESSLPGMLTPVVGVAHLTYLESDSIKLAFVKINALNPHVALTLFVAGLAGSIPAQTIEYDHVYIAAVSSEQESLLWRAVFGERLTKVYFDHQHEQEDAMMWMLDLKSWGWEQCCAYLSDYLSREVAIEVHDALAHGFERQPGDYLAGGNAIRAYVQMYFERRQPIANGGVDHGIATSGGGETLSGRKLADHSAPNQHNHQAEDAGVVANLMSVASSSVLPIPGQQASTPVLDQLQPVKPTWAYTFRIEQPMAKAVPEQPGRCFRYTAFPLSPVWSMNSALTAMPPMDDPAMLNTLSRQIERLQTELARVRKSNNDALQAVQSSIAEEQSRLKKINRSDHDLELYRARKKKLEERLAANKAQAERDAAARCTVCKNDESYLDNPIIICERCSGAAHKNCVNLLTVPNEDWFCDKCAGKEGSEPRRRGRPARRKLASVPAPAAEYASAMVSVNPSTHAALAASVAHEDPMPTTREVQTIASS